MLTTKFFQGLFYMGLSLFLSSLIVSEAQLGSSTLVGTVSSATSMLSIIATAGIFLWLKVFKGASNCVGMILVGLSCLSVGMYPTLAVIVIAMCVRAIAIQGNHVSVTTLMSIGPKGKVLSTITGIFVAITFISEALGGYVIPWLSNLVFQSTLPSYCLKIAGIGCIITGLIGLPFYRKMYTDVILKQK